MKAQPSRPKRRLTPEEMTRKKNALNEIRHLMVQCYPDTRSKRARSQILERVSTIFLQEFGSQKDEVRNQIINRLFNRGKTEKLVLDVNGKKAEFEVLRYAKLSKLDGMPVTDLQNEDLPKYFREGVMASLFEREVEKRLAAKKTEDRPIIDVTPQKNKQPQKPFPAFFAGGWLRRFQPFRSTMSAVS